MMWLRACELLKRDLVCTITLVSTNSFLKLVLLMVAVGALLLAYSNFYATKKCVLSVHNLYYWPHKLKFIYFTSIVLSAYLMIICKFDYRVHPYYLSNFWDFLIVCILSVQYCHSFFVTCSSSVSLLFIYVVPGNATDAITCRTGLSLCLAVRNWRTIFLLFGFYLQQSIYSPFIVTY